MKFVKTLMLIIFVTGLLVFFQNCGVSQNKSLLGSSTSSAATADKVVTDAPFAYDLVADTISYNSCVGANLNSVGISGLKIGVNEGFADSLGTGAVKSGLKLRSDFLQYIGKNIKPRYPSTVITPIQIQNVIENSPLNKDTYIQFAVRKKDDLSIAQDLIQPSATTQISVPRDGVINFTPLFTDPVLTSLAKNVQFAEGGVILSEGPRIYNLQDASSPTPIEASFGYSNFTDETYQIAPPAGNTENLGYGERYSETVRNAFSSSDLKKKYLLAITYGSGLSPTSATDYGLSTPKRKDETKKGNAYGRSFALQFGYPADFVAAGWKNTVLKQIIESNLVDGSIVSGAAWTCENYLIMKQNQWNSGVASQPACSPLTAADLLSAGISNKVKNLRRHYLESGWNIGFFYSANELLGTVPRLNHKLCLVPKATECYLPTETVTPGTDVGVNYNPLTECYLYNRYGTSYSNSLDVVKANGRCAQFASLCTRTSGNF